jgi:hypothetical protein
MGTFLVRGMLVGLFGAVLAFGFARTAGEPAVNSAIAFEEQEATAAGEVAEPEEVSRDVQSGIGLAVGLAITGVALGGFFAIGFAFAYGRLGALGARGTALAVGGLGFLAVYVVPFLKYPANPPAVGNPDTLNERTYLYFTMMAVSLLAMVLAVVVARRLRPQLGGWNAVLASAAGYAVVMVLATLVLPVIAEVPEGFPADTLWQFRTASIGIQLTLWASTALAFGALTHRAATRPAPAPVPTATAATPTTA